MKSKPWTRVSGLSRKRTPYTKRLIDSGDIKIGADDVSAARKLFDRGVKFVDVRGLDTWRQGHVPGAVNLFLKSAFSEENLSAVVGKNEEVVIYCMGHRCLLSSQASAKAVSWGFRRVYYLRDGYPKWQSVGYPVEVPLEQKPQPVVAQ